jgi:hypothetical protein
MGATTFRRGKGAPQTVTTELRATGFDGPFVLYVRNGTAEGTRRVSSAQVRLDGTLLLGPSDFSQNKPGARLPVSLSERSVLEVRLASAPDSELTIWIAGNPRLHVERDEAGAVTQEVPVEGGAICAASPDGTEFCLTIPPGALAEAQEIRITPILAIDNLPLTHGFGYGVEMEPHGTRFFRPATLEIRPVAPPPEGTLLGFAYDGTGRGFHLTPTRSVDGALQLPIVHFSGAGVGGGTIADISQAIDTAPAGSPQLYQNLLVLLLQSYGPPGPENIETYRAVFVEWYWTVVLPSLQEAVALGFDSPDFDDVFDAALGLWLEWEEDLCWFGLGGLCSGSDPILQPLHLQAYELVRQALGGLLAHLGEKCLATVDYCQRLPQADRWLKWVCQASLLGIESESPRTWCDGLWMKSVRSVALDPPSLTVREWKLAPLALIARGVVGQIIVDPPALAVTWTSANQDVALVDTTGDPRAAEVFGNGVGLTTVVAAVTQCSERVEAAAPVRVICPVESVEVHPSALKLRVRDKGRIDVILRDEDGKELQGGAYPVAFTPSSPIVGVSGDVDVTTGRWLARVEGLAPGVATVDLAVADCDARASFEVSVEGWPAAVSVDRLALSLKLGASAVLRATVTNEDGTENTGAALKWQGPKKLQPPADVSLEVTGPREVTVTALSVGALTHGRAEITATVEPPDAGSTITSPPVVVLVTPKVVGVEATLAVPWVLVGESTLAEAEALNENGSTTWMPALWTHQPDSSRPGQVRLERDESGLVRVFGVTPGLVWLTASIGPPAVDGDFVSRPVLLRVLPVTPPVVSVELTTEHGMLAVGVQAVLTAVPRFADGGTHPEIPVSWRLGYDVTRPPPVALDSLDQTARITGLSVGAVEVTAIVEPPFSAVPRQSEPVRLSVIPAVASAGVDRSACPVSENELFAPPGSHPVCWLSVGEAAWLSPVVTLADGSSMSTIPVSWDVRVDPAHPTPGLAAFGIEPDGSRIRLRGVDVGMVDVTPVVGRPFADPPLRGVPVSVRSGRFFRGSLDFTATYGVRGDDPCELQASGTRAARFAARPDGFVGFSLDRSDTVRLPGSGNCPEGSEVELAGNGVYEWEQPIEYSSTRARAERSVDSGIECWEYWPETGTCRFWTRHYTDTTVDLTWSEESAGGSSVYHNVFEWCPEMRDCTSAATDGAYWTLSESFASAMPVSSSDYFNVPTVGMEVVNPPLGEQYRVGDTVTVNGWATVPRYLWGPNLQWTVLVHHADHTHPLGTGVGPSMTFTYPAPDGLVAAETGYVEVRLAAVNTLDDYVVASVSRKLLPKTVDLTFATSPAGRHVVVQSAEITGPRTVTSWEGWELTVEAPDQDDGFASYRFSSWSDGGAQSHTITSPGEPATYTATFAPW